MTCTPHGPLSQSFQVSEVTTSQNHLGTHGDLFLFEHAKMLFHGKLREERILSPHASPVAAQAEAATENDRQTTEENKKDKDKDIVQDIAEERHSVTNGIKLKDYDLKQVHHHHHQNRCDALQERVAQSEQKDEQQAEEQCQKQRNKPNHKKQVEEENTGDVNNMSMAELVLQLKKHQEEIDACKKKIIAIDECCMQGNPKEARKMNQHVRSLEDRANEKQEKDQEEKVSCGAHCALNECSYAKEIAWLSKEYDAAGGIENMKRLEEENYRIKANCARLQQECNCVAQQYEKMKGMKEFLQKCVNDMDFSKNKAVKIGQKHEGNRQRSRCKGYGSGGIRRRN